MSIKLDSDTENKVIELYNSDVGVTEISRRLNIGKNTVLRVVKRNNVPRRMRGPGGRYKLSLDEKQQIKSLYESGVHTSILCKQFGCCNITILRAIKEVSGVVNRIGCQKIVFDKKDIDDIISEYQGGKSQTQIALKYNVSQSTISSILIKNKIRFMKRIGKYNSSWNGGITITNHGYKQVLLYDDDPYFVMTHDSGYVMEHRLVMAKHIGRPLTKNETVHHINGDKQDNRIENLQLRIGKHGTGERYKCNCCGSYDIISVAI